MLYYLDRTGKVLRKFPRPGGDVRMLHEYEEQALFWIEPARDDLEWLGFQPYREVMQLIDAKGSLLVPPGCVKHTREKPELQNLFPRYSTRKFGVVDHTGKVVVTPQWEGIKVFADGDGLIGVRKGDDIQYLNRNGSPTTRKPGRPAWQDAEGWQADYNPAAKKWGFKDESGKFVLGPEWDELQNARITRFNDGLAGAKKDGRWGFIDRTGKAVIPFEYGAVGAFSEGLAAVRKDGKFGFVDTTGKLVIPLNWDGVEEFRNGVASINLGGERDGQDSFMLTKGGKWGLIDKSGKVIVPVEWKDVRGLSQNRAWISKDAEKGKLGGSYALLDTAIGDTLTDFEWQDWRYNGDFSEEGLLLSKRGGLYGYLNAQGEVVIKLQFGVASQFSKGAAVVWTDSEDPSALSGIINAKGEWIFKSRPGAQLLAPNRGGSLLTDLFHGLAVIEETGPWGFVRINAKAAASQPATTPPPASAPSSIPSTKRLNLFNGRTLAGWKVLGTQNAFSVANEAIRGSGKGASLVYVGDDSAPPAWTDFDLACQVKTEEKANSGLWVHVPEPPPRRGALALEVQIDNEGSDPQKTGSLWSVKPVSTRQVRDGQWFALRVSVKGGTVRVFIDNKLVNEWTQPPDWQPPATMPEARLGSGTIGLQSNGGEVWFKNIEVIVPSP